jgi:hypothetical protein
MGGSGAGLGPGRRRALRDADSPTKLRLATAVTVVLAIALSLGGWYSIDRRDTAIDDAAGAASQLIQVQDVRVQLVEADSLASTAYLVGGQEPPEQRAAYDERLAAAAAGLLAAAGDATTEDAADLRVAGERLTVYTGLVEQARANNRQGFPVGAAYQRRAREVASEVVAALRTVEQRTRDRVDDSMQRAARASWLLVVTLFVVLGALIAGSWWLAMRWRRLVNVPIAVAIAIGLLLLTLGLSANANAVSTASDAVRGPLSAADLVAQARAAGFDARSSEALTLINRGNGAAYEQQWQLSADVMARALDESCRVYDVGCSARAEADRYSTAHRQVRALDDAGDWDRAVDLATAGTIDGERQGVGANPPADFADFAESSGADVAAQAAAAQRAFDDADDSLPLLRLLVVLAGLAIAVLASVGYGQRLKEYR